MDCPQYKTLRLTANLQNYLRLFIKASLARNDLLCSLSGNHVVHLL